VAEPVPREKHPGGASRLLLVVCTGNICRSPMAEGLLRTRLAAEGLDGWRIESRGLHAVVGRPATAEAVRALEELGLDIRAHRGRQMSVKDARAAELILALETWQRDAIRQMVPEAPGKVQLLTHYQAEGPDRDIEDPYGTPYRFYCSCRGEIEQAVEAVVEHLKGDSSPRL
jgi:protein-tyrosine-phosphatase